MNSKFDVESHYYSGNGVVMVGERTAAGQPKGLRPLGEVTGLVVAIDTSTLTHREHQTGQRGIDKRLTTETNATVTIDLQNYNARNLALAFRAAHTEVPAGSVTGEMIPIYPGLVSALRRIDVSDVVLTGLTAFVDEETPWDYKVNEDAGSVLFNDGSLVAAVALGGIAAATAVTAGTAGATTSLTTAAAARAPVGSKVMIAGATGADAASVNGKTAEVLTNNGTVITVDIDTTGDTITFTTATVTVEGDEVAAAYDYGAQQQVDALTEGSVERWLRFEGLNTADGNEPVVVELFRFEMDPASERALIQDDFATMTLTGTLLVDSTKTTGSKFFRETLLRR